VQLKGTQTQKEEDTFDQNLTETLKQTTLNPNKSDQEALYLELDPTIIYLQKQKKKSKHLQRKDELNELIT
jgi:hypothetical protein